MAQANGEGISSEELEERIRKIQAMPRLIVTLYSLR